MSNSFSVVAPMLGSGSGVSAGQFATTNGLGPDEGCVESVEHALVMHAIAIDRLFTNLRFHPLTDGRLCDLDAGDLSRRTECRLFSNLGDQLGFSGVTAAFQLDAVGPTAGVTAKAGERGADRADQQQPGQHRTHRGATS